VTIISQGQEENILALLADPDAVKSRIEALKNAEAGLGDVSRGLAERREEVDKKEREVAAREVTVGRREDALEAARQENAASAADIAAARSALEADTKRFMGERERVGDELREKREALDAALKGVGEQQKNLNEWAITLAEREAKVTVAEEEYNARMARLAELLPQNASKASVP
jgi:chromosome segregation ATPase